MSKKPDNLIHPDSHVSDVVIKHWLKVNGFPHSAATKEELLELLGKLVDTGSLTKQGLRDAIREIEETGGKRIFLRTLVDKDAVRSQADFERHLRAKKLRLDDAPTNTYYLPGAPILNYISWDAPGKKKKRGDRIRIKYSETQLRRNIDLEAEAITTEKITKFVVIIMELGTGFTCIMLDYPELVHEHKDREGKSRREMYEQFYFDKISEIFDSPLQRFDLGRAIEKLVYTKPYVIRIPNEKVRTGGNSRQSYASVEDVRYDPARQGAERADGENWEFEDLQGYWIPKMSKEKLQRELFTQLVRANSMIRVLADCLRSEMDYVISRIR